MNLRKEHCNDIKKIQYCVSFKLTHTTYIKNERKIENQKSKIDSIYSYSTSTTWLTPHNIKNENNSQNKYDIHTTKTILKKRV